MGEHLKIIEYPLILLFIITGAVFLISTNDLISIFLSIELQSYGLYLLSTIYRNSELSTTGGLIYFLLGGLSSCFILLGTALLYANSGTTNIDGFYIITSIGDIHNTEILYKTYYISFSLLIFSIGFLFKVSAAPFHFWSPDVYDAIPTIVTTFVAIIAKISIFIFLLELVYYTSNYFHDLNWTFSLLISSFFSLIVGTIVGLTQFRIKRLFAYSTISHVGFILLALSLTMTIFSFVGIPPLVGFFAKQMVLSAALDSGYVFLTLVAILTSVISAVYYLNIIKEVFFYEPIYKVNRAFKDIIFHGNIIKNNNLFKKLTFKLDNITLSSSLTITISSLTLIILLFIFVPGEWLNLANILALLLFNP